MGRAFAHAPYKTMFKELIRTIITAFMLFGVLFIVSAYTPPLTAPPGGNVPAPLNTGPSTQSKSGNLIVNGLNAGLSPGAPFPSPGVLRDPSGNIALVSSGAVGGGIVNGGGALVNFYANDYWIGAAGKWASAPAAGGTGFGAWETRFINTGYTAATDGFVVVNVNDVTDLLCWIRVQTPIGVTRQSSWPNSDHPQVSETSPVKKGDTWQVSTGGCDGAITVYWIPLGN